MNSIKTEILLSFPFRLTINAFLALLLLKVYFFVTSQNQMNSIYLVSFVQDAFLIFVNYFLFVFSTRKFPKLFFFSRTLFFLFYFLVGITSFLYTFFLFDFLSFPVNIFGITGDNISFFTEYFMDVSLMLTLFIGAGAMLAVSFFFPKKIKWNRLPVVVVIVLTLLFIPTILRPAINPIVYSLQEQIMLSATANSNISKLTLPVSDGSKVEQFRFLDKAFDTIPKLNIRYDRVVVLVMEGINYDEFTTKSLADVNSFINLHKQHTISFTNYHTLNLDSYTALIAMLNSIFVPYQAYVNEEKFVFVNKRNNLVRFFNANGFSTHFLTSYGEQQKRFVPDISEWTQVKCKDNIDGSSQYACITTNKIEYACEDLAVFNDLMTMLRNNHRAFVYQEMVYAHTTEWKAKTGIETIDYYNHYFNKVVDELRANNLLDGTLIVILSDHGPRTNAYNRENYHIPMMVFATDLQQDNKSKFLSHLDFKDILLELIAGKEFTPKQDPIYTVGHSGELIYGMIGSSGKFIFINNRLRHVNSNVPESEVARLNKSFQDYTNYFAWLRATSTNQLK